MISIYLLFSLLCSIQAINYDPAYVMASSWSMWSPWSFCSNDVMVRVRACSTVRGFKCVGHNKEFQSCNSGLRPVHNGDNLDYDHPDEDREMAMKQLYQDYEPSVPDVPLRPSQHATRPPTQRNNRPPSSPAQPVVYKAPGTKDLLIAPPSSHRDVINVGSAPNRLAPPTGFMPVARPGAAIPLTPTTSVPSTTSQTTPTPPTTQTTTTTTIVTSSTAPVNSNRFEIPARWNKEKTEIHKNGVTKNINEYGEDEEEEDEGEESVSFHGKWPMGGEEAVHSKKSGEQKVPSEKSDVIEDGRPEMIIPTTTSAIPKIQEDAVDLAQTVKPVRYLKASYVTKAPTTTSAERHRLGSHERAIHYVDVAPSTLQTTTLQTTTEVFDFAYDDNDDVTEKTRTPVRTSPAPSVDDNKVDKRVREEERVVQTVRQSFPIGTERDRVQEAITVPSSVSASAPPRAQQPIRLPANSFSPNRRAPSRMTSSVTTPTTRPTSLQDRHHSHITDHTSSKALKAKKSRLERLNRINHRARVHTMAVLSTDTDENEQIAPVAVAPVVSIDSQLERMNGPVETKKNSHSGEIVPDFSFLPEEERRMLEETRQLEERVMELKRRVDRQRNTIETPAKPIDNDEDVLMGDTARALSWMIANMTSQVGEEGAPSLPIVDMIPLERVDQPSNIKVPAGVEVVDEKGYSGKLENEKDIDPIVRVEPKQMSSYKKEHVRKGSLKVRWSAWSVWSDCFCGKQARTRTCLGAKRKSESKGSIPVPCPPEQRETRNCQSEKCI